MEILLYILVSILDSKVRMRCCVSMLKMLVYPLLNDATIWLGSLLTRSTEAGIPNSRTVRTYSKRIIIRVST